MEELLRKLASLEISLVVNDDQLDIYDPKELLSEEILENVKRNKLKLLEILKEGSESYVYTALQRTEEKPFYKLSSAQKRIYFLHELDKTSLVYNMPQIVKFTGTLDKEWLEHSLNKLVSTYEILRTSFETIEGIVSQCIAPHIELRIEHYQATTDNAVQDTIEKFVRPFDLQRPPLLRIGLIEVSLDEHLLIVDMHHIIADGISQAMLIRDFIALYNKQQLVIPSLQYKDYAEWQQSESHRKGIEKQRRFWLNEFSGGITQLELPTDFTRPPMMKFLGDSVDFSLGAKSTNALKSIASREGTTLFMVILALYNILLSKLCNQEDIVVGTPVAGRGHADLENIIGMFVNVIPLKNICSGELTFLEFLSIVKEKALKAFDNQFYPYEELVDALKTERVTSRNPLFDVALVYQNSPEVQPSIPGIKIDSYRQRQSVAKFDITLTAFESADQIFFNLEYSTELFRQTTVLKFIQYFQKIVSHVIQNIHVLLSRVEIIPDSDRDKILDVFNNTRSPYPDDYSVARLFEEQVKICPNKIALADSILEVTYAELDERANGIAGFLIRQGLAVGECVAILANRSIETVTAFLGVLKAGGVYVPIDIEFPKERILYMLRDCKARMLLVQSERAELISEGVEQAVIGLIGKELIAKPSRVLAATSPAYVMYTSGSVGSPKGVIVTNRNIIRLVRNTNYITLDESIRILQTGAPAFDATTFEIWGSLLNGGTLYLVEKNDLVVTALLGEKLQLYKINTLWLTSSLFNHHVQNDVSIFRSLRNLLVGGEALVPHFINRLRDEYPSVQIINGYGPTENTTFSVCHRITENYSDSIPIGKPVSNSTAYVFDKYGNLQPIGIAGELWVGGDGVSNGYLNAESLTKARFVSDPNRAGGRLYKTGDIALYLENGTIEYRGRFDNQIKLHGFRIELQEIQNLLNSHPSISYSAVTCIGEESQKNIAAYYILREPTDASEIRQYLSKTLPRYMVPTFYVRLDKIPLTPNGKLDIRALPIPEIEDDKYIPPATEIEKKLAEIWGEILKVEIEQISVDKSFFDMGGHSLNATVLVNKIRREMNVRVPLSEVFKNADIRNLGKYILQAEVSKYLSIEKAPLKEYYSLSPAQRKLYFFYKFDEKSLNYNIPQVIELEKSVSKETLKRILSTLITRHESLRTFFDVAMGEPVQRIVSEVDFELESIDTHENDLSSIIHKFIRPFDLSRAPLLRAGIVQVGNEHQKLILDMHHIIADLTSNEILAEEFNQLVSGNELRPLRLQYKDYSEWQNHPEQQNGIKSERQYWLKVLDGMNSPIRVPGDLNGCSSHSKSGMDGGFVTVYLDQEQHDSVKRFCEGYSMKSGILLYSLFVILVSKLSAERDVIIGLSIPGRRHADLERIIGLFVNEVPIRSYPDEHKVLCNFIDEIKEATISAYENQECQFNELLEGLNIQNVSDRNPLFNVTFNVAGQWKRKFDLSQIPPGYLHTQGSKRYDLSLNLFEYSNTLGLKLQYDSRLFSAKRAEEYLDYLVNILLSVGDLLYKPLSDIVLKRNA